MQPINLYEAKTRLSQLVDAAQKGEEVIIARYGKPVARLVPINTSKRQLGLLDGEFLIPEDFDAPLPDEVMQAFNGK